VVDDLAVAYLERAAVGGYALFGYKLRLWEFVDFGTWRPGALSAGSKLDEHMPVGRVHQVALRVVAQRLDESTLHIELVIDDAPGTEQCLA
jgi:hypothetical protein